MSRSQWGADETLRYSDTSEWLKILKANARYKPTAAQKKAAQKRQRIYDWLRTDYPQEFVGSVRHTDEDGHKLIWPVENSMVMDKIVVHHTGEWSDTSDKVQARDEAAIVRGIYAYHARTRQWGDIGYNYVVGKSGTVYEGRAGGPYAVAAHAVWNNQNSIGISLMGDYDTQTPPQAQIEGLVRLLAVLSRQYGIDFSAVRQAHRECTGHNCQRDGETIEVLGLSGHRDAGHTNCPGARLYPLLEKIRRLETFSRGREPIPRVAAGTIAAQAPEPSEERTPDEDGAPVSGEAAVTAAPTMDADAVRRAALATFGGTGSADAPRTQVTDKPVAADPAAQGVDAKTIRIKLSVPESSRLDIGPADGGTMALASGKKTGTAKGKLTLEKSGKDAITLRLAGKSLTFTDPVRFSGGVLEIANWKRTPAWDKTGTVNDDAFRGTLEVRNRGGKWLVVNELPVGEYVRGLGEVSEGDPEHKAKAIITAARTYAAYYLGTDRKFPGQPYDGSDDPAVFQRYLGYGLEKRSPSLARYAAETRDVVITYSGALIKPWYFNASTGKTRSAKQYCEANGGKNCKDIPFLQSVEDPGTHAAKYLGHGVGVSGNGATALALRGWTYDAILKYFLKGVDVRKPY